MLTILVIIKQMAINKKLFRNINNMILIMLMSETDISIIFFIIFFTYFNQQIKNKKIQNFIENIDKTQNMIYNNNGHIVILSLYIRLSD